jgi:hypothetical protein
MKFLDQNIAHGEGESSVVRRDSGEQSRGFALLQIIAAVSLFFESANKPSPNTRSLSTHVVAPDAQDYAQLTWSESCG